MISKPHPLKQSVTVASLMYNAVYNNNSRAPNFLFQEVPSPLPRFFRGYFHPPPPHYLKGYHCMFKGAKLSQYLSVTKPYFECSIWILNLCNAHSFLQPKKKQLFWCWYRFAFYCIKLMFCHKWKKLTIFQADAHCTVQSFRWWTHPSLANLEGQLHAQDRHEGGENRF